MRNFKQLEVWKDSRILAKEIHLLSANLPDAEKFGLASQIRRCVISIPSNIAEGSAKESEKDFCRFLQISLGSSFELETQLILCQDLELLNFEAVDSFLKQLLLLQRKISSFIKYLNR
ncbi:MAG TPA: four helix bundle protein [Flavobacterium sp.]|jgi:four helix bundle protein